MQAEFFWRRGRHPRARGGRSTKLITSWPRQGRPGTPSPEQVGIVDGLVRLSRRGDRLGLDTLYVGHESRIYSQFLGGSKERTARGGRLAQGDEASSPARAEEGWTGIHDVWCRTCRVSPRRGGRLDTNFTPCESCFRMRALVAPAALRSPAPDRTVESIAQQHDRATPAAALWDEVAWKAKQFLLCHYNPIGGRKFTELATPGLMTMRN